MARYDDARQVWRITADATVPGGKRRRAVRDVAAANTRAGRKIAELAEAKLRVEVAERLEYVSPGVTGHGGTFAAAAAGWVARNAHSWSPATVKMTRIALRCYILPTLGAIPLEAVTPAQIEQLYASWAAAGKSASARRRYHGMLHSIYADAERLDLLAGRNPMTRVRPAGGKAPERHVPGPADVRAVIAAAASPATACFFELAAGTGARRGTLLALRWRDIDLEAATISFAHAISQGEDGPVIKGTKADRPYAVTIVGPGLEALRDHRRRAAETALALGLSGDLGGLFVFSADGGVTHWAVSYPSHAWRIARNRAGVPDVHLHDLRHFAATRLLRKSVPTRVVADRLGCTETNVIRTYSHRVPSDDDARAAQILADALSV
jgi:integrase